MGMMYNKIGVLYIAKNRLLNAGLRDYMKDLKEPEDSKKALFLRQKNILDKFLERGAISQAQYDKSFGDLKEKMEIEVINIWKK